MRKGPSNGFVLRFAKKWLGLGYSGVRKEMVWDVACKTLGVPTPPGKSAGYLRLHEFYQRFHAQPSPYTPPPTKRQTRPAITSTIDPNSDAFLLSYEWRVLRMVVLKKYGARCQCCGATRADGVRIHVDHIKPRRKHPELALTESNLQVLCEVCNHGKAAWDDTDWRDDSQLSGERSRTPVSRSGDGDEQIVTRARGLRLATELKKATG